MRCACDTETLGYWDTGSLGLLGDWATERRFIFLAEEIANERKCLLVMHSLYALYTLWCSFVPLLSGSHYLCSDCTKTTIDHAVGNMDGISNITDIIRVKERELQKIQDMRFAQLEKTIEERDQLLLESNKRFEQLKDDFQYNLRLLEARDIEISRLEGIIEKQGRDKEDLESQVKNLLFKIESVQQNEKERIDKFEQEKALSKRILSETKAIIESMQWSAEEDARLKNNEIATLKKDIQLLHRAKDEAIEIQRRDLTAAFEQIIQQREEQITQREGELAHQISMLDQRFERMSTENIMLKSNMKDIKSQHDKDVEEVCRLEEINRQLDYQLEDTIRNKEQVEDSLRRQIGNLQSELSKVQDARNREKQDLESQIEKYKNEALRERDFRSVVEKRLEETQEDANSEVYSLNEEIRQQQRRIHTVEQEVDDVKGERDQILMKLGNKRVEAETLVAKNRMLIEELESASERNRRFEQNYQALEATMLQLQKEFDHYKLLMDRELNLARDSAKDEIVELKRSSTDQAQRIRSNHEEEIQKLRNLYEEKLMDKQKEVDEMRTLHGERYIQDNREKDAEITQLKIQYQVKEKALQDERTESEALRLRLKSLEAQLLSSTQELRQLKSNFNSLRPTTTTSFPPTSNGLGANDLSLLEIPTFDLTSPMMSDDFNISNLQYPDSSLISTSKFAKNRRNHYAAGIVSTDNEYVLPAYGFSLLPSQKPPVISLPPPPPPPQTNNQQLDAVTAENENLKKVVKEMRQDIKSLRILQEQQQASATPFKSAPVETTIPAILSESKALETTETPSTLEEVLRERQDEIERLKRERKKLMDTGNELRSALLKVQEKDLEEKQESIENLCEENLDTVYQWIRGKNDDRYDGLQSRSRLTDGNDYFNHLRGNDHGVTAQRYYDDDSDRPYYDDDEVSLDANMLNNDELRCLSRNEKDFAYDTLDSDRGRKVEGEKPVTALRRRQKDPKNVVGNSLSARSAPRSGIYPATRPLSAGYEGHSNRQMFVVHKVPPGGYLNNKPGRVAALGSRSNSNRVTSSQAQALDRLKQLKQKQAENRV